MERVWLIVATLCLVTAAFFLWRALVDEAYVNAAFVAASLGVVAWFLRLRIQIKRTIPPSADLPADDADDDEDADKTDEN
ncbi:MAG TPA: hypothetical protein VF658_02965 [Pyrinomonadaceae bacterium]|jgi:uncharacterized membrane protein